jgi:hypothetical protein
MQKPKVTMIIHGDGSGFSVDVEGVKGSACQRIQKDFEGMGVRVDERKKPEFFEVPPAVQNLARR